MFFWYCYPKAVGLEGLSNLLLFNPTRTGGGGRCFPPGSRFLPITLEVIKEHSRNLVTFPKI